MSFFSNYSQIIYSFQNQKFKSAITTNILVSAKFVDLFPEKTNQFYVDYIVKDGEKPEHIANRVYNDPNLHWIILLSNQIYNPLFDWPLSDSELDAYIKKKYPGSALFFECVGSYATRYKIQNSDTYLPETKSYFIEGNTITQQQGNVTVSGTIIDWDPTFRKVVVDNISGGSFSALYDCYTNNVDGTQFRAKPKKVVLENSEAVHHFIDDFNNYLDPYGKINYYEYDDHKVYSKQNVFYKNKDGLPQINSVGATGNNDFVLNKYINGTQNNTITNRFYETIENDIKRSIKILRIEFVENLTKQLEKLFYEPISI